MPEVESPKKRLVPWKEYLLNRITKKGLSGLFFVLAWVLPILFLYLNYNYQIVGLPLFFFYVVFGIHLLAKMMVSAEQIEEVGLLTSEKIGQLLAEETLVRAATEPTPEPEKVLLRAATNTEETPPEQLLRPSSTTE